ncbi:MULTISPECIES: J domain-containing protein [Pseudovibrio]|uniref:J domain-containing protein n=1 Tax=Stappiaceae TaxID=2821832 RepID=UPI002365E119|nr:MULTISPECIES: DnaJ family molecular chaperone [Pseudovibrio]MDD7910306.1 DnaJ family molecular chaperone [Pseudovibrio exalbescens]MDX5594021.1 DnaJ family molecular chaperone [Pseudovibrio sp. SPO723]
MDIWSRLSAIVVALQESSAQLAERLQQLIKNTGEARRSVAFTAAMIALSAKMAKADGVVTTDEILAFYELFEIPEGEERNVARLFSLAQQDVAGYDLYAEKLYQLLADDPQTCVDVLDGLFYIAKADGVIHEAELSYLEKVASIFRLEPVSFSRIKARHMRGHYDPYMVLGVDPEISDLDLQKVYRQEVRETHPDRLIGRGVPEEFVRIANERLAALNAAYAQVRAERGL